MTPIDLFDYTDTKHKIPSASLNHSPKQVKEFQSWKILAAFGLDFMIAVSAQLMIIGVLHISLGNYMTTQSLQKSFFAIPFSDLGMSLTPLFFMSYYFFSYLFNHGQTYGQFKMKTRIEMPQMSYRSSFYWATFSTILMMTFGISYPLTYRWMQEMGYGKFVSQDHLYHELMTPKEFAAANLLDLTQQFEQEAKVQTQEEEHYSRAA